VENTAEKFLQHVSCCIKLKMESPTRQAKVFPISGEWCSLGFRRPRLSNQPPLRRISGGTMCLLVLLAILKVNYEKIILSLQEN